MLQLSKEFKEEGRNAIPNLKVCTEPSHVDDKNWMAARLIQASS